MRIAASLGEALGSLHGSSQEEFSSALGDPLLSAPLPWILSIHQPDVNVLRTVSSANLQLIRLMQKYDDFARLLDNLRSGWRSDTLIHQDIKSDNCLVAYPPGQTRGATLKIIDWESACMGDPAWDVGSVFSDYLCRWVLAMPIMGDGSPEKVIERSPCPLERMQPSLGAFWKTYSRHLALRHTDPRGALVRAIRYGAARIVQTAFEYMQGTARLTANVGCLLQLSLNIMRSPETAAEHLLGLPLPSLKG